MECLLRFGSCDALSPALCMYPRLLVPTWVPPCGGEGERVADFREPCIAWRKSTASDSGNCVEVAIAEGSVLIRDSANRDGVMLRFSPAVWCAFLECERGTDPGTSQA